SDNSNLDSRTRSNSMNLTAYLLDAYATTEGNKKAGDGLCVRLDDQSASDGHRGFCQIHVTAESSASSTVLLELSPVRHNEEVIEVVLRHGGKVAHDSLGLTIRMPLGPKDARLVRDLARAIRRVVRRGQRYSDSNWKWMCPRTASSLDRFAKHLAAFHQA